MRSIGWMGLGMATVAALGLSAPAMADDMVEDKLATMEKRIKYLEERVASQDQMIVDKESEIASLADGWFNSVSVGGAIELELVSESPAGEDSTTSAGVGKAELGIGAAINDEWSGEIVIENDDGTIALADAFLTYEPGGGLAASGGQQGVPFGVYDTNLITDPLTKDLGDTSGVSLVLGGEAGQLNLNWSLFALQPEEDGQFAENYGVAVGVAMEGDGGEFGLDVGWINGLANAMDIQGAAVSARGSLGPASALVEYVTTLEAPEGEATPTAWHAEAAYGFDLMGREATLAVGAGGTDDGEAAELAESLMLLGVSIGVWENVGIGVEWKQTEGYGADGSDDAVTVLLAAEF